MSFKLNLNNIDTNFPVPGVDNPSQGFRDNFSIIENNFVELDDVVGTLDEVAVRLNTTNDFNGQGVIENVILKAAREEVNNSYRVITEENSIECNWTEGGLYTINVDSSVEEPLVINLNDWPASGYTKMVLMITKDGSEDREIIFRAKNNTGTIKQNNMTSFLQSGSSPTSMSVILPLTEINPSPNTEIETTEPVMIEAFTYNGASIVFLNYVGKFV